MAGIELNWTTEPPTKLGTYWFKREPASRAIMVDVRVTDGQLTVCGPTKTNPWRRSVCLSLSRRGSGPALHSEYRVRQVEAAPTEFAYYGCMRTSVSRPP